jgi:hypothetical protein
MPLSAADLKDGKGKRCRRRPAMTSLSCSHLPGTIPYSLLIVSSGREWFADQSRRTCPSEFVAWDTHVLQDRNGGESPR